MSSWSACRDTLPACPGATGRWRLGAVDGAAGRPTRLRGAPCPGNAVTGAPPMNMHTIDTAEAAKVACGCRSRGAGAWLLGHLSAELPLARPPESAVLARAQIACPVGREETAADSALHQWVELFGSLDIRLIHSTADLH